MAKNILRLLLFPFMAIGACGAVIFLALLGCGTAIWKGYEMAYNGGVTALNKVAAKLEGK